MTIIVGNGSSAIGKGLGDQIDAADRIYRCNNYVLQGFERDLGTRTTDWVHHMGIQTEREGVHDWWLSSPKDFHFLFRLYRVMPGHVIPLRHGVDSARDAGLPDGFHSSCGLHAVYHAMESGDRVAIVNFDHANTGHYFDATHTHSGCHDWDKERTLMNRLVEQGRIERW